MGAMTDPMNRPFGAPETGAPEPGSTLALAVEKAREHAIRVLSDGYAYDVLTEDEFEWRLGQLSLANSPAEVQALIADLPAGATPATAGHVGTRYPGAPVPAEERIRGVMSEVRRDGVWRLPQRLRVSAVMSDVRLDLREAVIPAGCVIEVRAIMAGVRIIVPPGLRVEFDVSPFMGAAGNDSSRMPTAFSAPVIRVTGSAVMAEVRVRVRDPRY
jgi:hypothetical protein